MSDRRKTVPTDSVTLVKREGRKYYRLENGRLIPVPPRGGAVSQIQIRNAVRSVVKERRQAKLG